MWAAPATPRWRPFSWTARAPPGRRTRSDDLGHGAHAGEVAVVAGDEQDPLLVAGVYGQRDGHAREDDGVVERNQEET